MSETIKKQKEQAETQYIESSDRNLSDNFTLDNLSANLVLSLERSKVIHDLYENNNSLKEKSNRLTRALDNEKNINNLQSEFVSLVSHEFKTPLSIIKASSDILKLYSENLSDAEFITKQLEKVDKAIIRMTSLIDSTLNLSKLETGQLQFTPSLFSIKTVLSETIEKFQDLHKEAQIITKIDITHDYYNGDKGLVEQIFNNLIGNALKYSGEEAKLKIMVKKESDKYVITIADNGIGIDAKDVKRLFTKFFRAKNSIGIAGTGIGLYLVKKFIDLHHGDIKVESKLNKGTKFIIILPIE
ncbi:MAG: HAMP domain-containing histidine kinase [Rickettsiales bacterium]|nr:HAMP domain-containing histidine kinase [Rickettsiales bacterium]